MSGSRLNYEWLIALLVLVASIMGCSRDDPVSLLMEDLEEATETRDVNAFEKRLASGFTGNDQINREEALVMLRRYFAAYEQITIDVSNLKKSNSGNRLTFQVSFSGKTNAAFNLQSLLPSTAVYDFELRLVQEESMLKVQKAFWQEVSGMERRL